MKNWSSLPFKIKIYIVVVVLAATPIFIETLNLVISSPLDYPSLILTAFTLMTVPIFVLLPSIRSGVTIGDAFVMSICMMRNPFYSAIMANMLYICFLTLLLKRRHNTPPHRIVLNIATAAINVWLYGIVFHRLQVINPNNDVTKILLPTFGLGITFFLSNSIFIATAISLSSHEKLFRVWKKNYAPLALEFLVSACAAGIIVFFMPLLLPQSDTAAVVGPLFLAPVVLLVWGWSKVNGAKKLAAESHLAEQEQLYLRTVETLALAVDAKDQTTYGHIRRVKAYSLGLAKLRKINDADELRAIDYASLLHDIGKLAIEDYILNKPGRLSKQEFEKMKVHATAGDEILQQVQFKIPVARYVRCHHERWDGTGYPDGLKGEEIPLGARILSIADAFDAIRSTRPYKSAFGIDDSVELLRAQAGSSFDPRLVELFINHINELETAAEEAAKSTSELSFRKYYENIESALAQADASRASQLPPATASEELIRLFEFCGGTGRSLGFADALPTLARRLKQIVPYDCCVFYGYHDDTSVKAEYACGDLAESLQGISIGLGKGISGWVAAHKRPMINTDPVLEFQGIEGNFNTLKDALVVPLVLDGDCLGTISLYTNQPAFYSPTHLSLLQTVAEQVAPLMREIGHSGKNQEDSFLDPVTGIYRFSYLSAAGSQILAHAATTESSLSLVYLDIKNFAHYMVLYGSGTGDLILRKVSDVLRSELRQTDLLVRFGQHGFVVLLPGVSSPQALRYVHRLQQMIKSTPVSPAPGTTLVVTCQAGIASYPNDGSDLLALLHVAQKALYEQAKLASPQVAGSEGIVLEFPPRI
jgi:diguanylate cyclase (GGDEF)-like protein